MNDHFTNMRDLNGSLAEALNMIDPSIEHHHQQTAYLAWMIARAADFDEEIPHSRHDMGNACSAHDQCDGSSGLSAD